MERRRFIIPERRLPKAVSYADISKDTHLFDGSAFLISRGTKQGPWAAGHPISIFRPKGQSFHFGLK